MRAPNAAEFSVLFWLLLLFLLGFGVVCLYFGYRAPPDKADEAAKAIRGGYGFIASAVAIYGIRRWFCGYSS